MSAEWQKTPCFEHQCSKCCRQTEMPVTNADISRIISADLQNFSTVESFTIALPDGSVRLANSPATQACVFLKTDSPDLHAPGTCEVWEDRPEGCRIYPLVLDQSDQPFLDELCPHRDQFPAPPIGLRGRLLVLSNTLDDESIQRT